ncbi:MAG: TrmH family RNA methyltransferase [Candidatus Marinamargulisbacteria bacterium]
MISQRDIERWFESSHFRRKCDWVCIDQPKVIKAWANRHLIGQFIIAADIEPPEWVGEKPLLQVPRQWLSNVSQKPSHPGMMVIIERPTFKLSDLLTCSKAVILDGVQDPGNLGTIIRSMVAFGVDILCLTNDCVDVFHPKAVNASSGALADIKIYNESHWADWLPTVPHPVYVLDPVGSSLVHNMSKKDAFVLVCGSEGRGIQSKLVQSTRLTPVSIHMTNDMESLNAAISVSIGLHQLTLP